MSKFASSIQVRKAEIAKKWFETNFAPDLLRRYPNEYAENVDRNQVENGYLCPLIDLIAEYHRSGDTVYRDLYLVERRRFAPHLEGPETLSRYFSEVIPADEEVLVTGLDAEDDSAIRAWLGELHVPLVEWTGETPLRIAMIGDCLLSEIQIFLFAQCRNAGVHLDTRYYYFSARMGKDLSADNVLELLRTTTVDLIALSFLSYEGIPFYRSLLYEASRLSSDEIERRITAIVGIMRRYLETLRETTEAPFLLHKASGLPLSSIRRRLPFLPPLHRAQVRVLSALNESIAELAQHTSNCFVIDEADVAREHGLRNCAKSLVPPRMERNADFHPSQFGRHLAERYMELIESYRALQGVKLLLIDLDGTLWEGVMAEGGVSHHPARQRLLKRLKNAGILLAAVSKNTESNIRWEETEFVPEDFVLRKINWNVKVQSVREIASELNLDLNSFLLLDDNPVERELVKTETPTVRTLDPNASDTWALLERLLNFPNTRDTDEARARTEMYRAQTKRRESMNSDLDFPSMMKRLDLRVAFGMAKTADVDRVCELVQRTNQFNTTTLRYSRSDIEAMIACRDHDLFVAGLSDKFGDLGIVAVVVVARGDDQLTIDNFVMSCRAMGFGLEQLVLARTLAASEESHRVVGHFVPTARNGPSSSLFSEAGFERTADGEWLLEAGAAYPAEPDWFHVSPR